MRQISILTVAGLTVLAGVGAVSIATAGDIYCNNQGHDCSDRPSPGSTMVRSTPPAGGYGQQAASSMAAPTSGNTPGTEPAPDAGANDRLKQDATRAAVKKDVAATRAEQCKQAKDRYQKSVEARRVYRVNKAGEREYLSESEADQERLNARLEMERSCGSGTGS